MNRKDVAQIAHEVNRAYCKALGDDSQVAWSEAPEWQIQSALSGVNMHMDNANAGVEDSHNAWREEKLRNGWKHGPVKDAQKREHPCMVDFADLSREQQVKDYLFRGVVHALRVHVNETAP